MELLFHDAALVAVNKPAGVPAQPDRTGDPDVARLTGIPGLTAVHRLDRPVAGVMLLASTATALAALNRAFAEGLVRKTYLAIVEGRVEGDLDLVHAHVHDARAHKARLVAADAPGGSVVRLRARVLGRGDRYSLLEVRPEGGRFHQIRAQLAAAGHPIKGDVKYGARRGEPDRSIALFALRAELPHPVSGEALVIEAPMPTTGLWPRLMGQG